MFPSDDTVQGLLAPRAVAIVGASERSPFSVRVRENLIRGGYPGRIVLINPRRTEAFGEPCYPSLGEAPPTDLAIILLAREHVEAAVEDAVQAGCKGIVVFAVGFRDSQEPDWVAAEQRIAERARHAGCVLVGPNCLGVAFAPARLAGLGAPIFWPMRDGLVALAMQSGALLHSAMRCLEDLEVGVRYAVSIGNGTAFSIGEWAGLLAARDDVRTIGLLVEEFGEDWDAFARAADLARETGKQIVVLNVGRTEVGKAVAQSHTGALGSEYAVIRDGLRQVGAREASSFGEFLGALALRERFGVPTARGVAMFSPTGGTNGLSADLAADQNLTVAALTAETRDALAEIPDFAGTVNPLDLNDRWSFDLDMIEHAVTAVLSDPGVGAGLYCASTLPDEHFQPLIAMLERIGRAAARAGKPVLLTEVGFGRLDPVLERFLAAHPWTMRLPNTRDLMGATRIWTDDPQLRGSTPTLPLAAAPAIQWRDEYWLKRLLKDRLGGRVVTPPSHLLRWPAEPGELSQLSADIGDRPLFLKALGPQLLHRSKHGLIQGPVESHGAVAALVALDDTAQRGGFDIDGLLVEEAAPPGIDLIVGVTRQPIGLALMLGRGGGDVEARGDHRFVVLPAAPGYVLSVVSDLLRSDPEASTPDASLAGEIVAGLALELVSIAAEAQLSSIECNPVRVIDDGSVWILDALALT